MNEDIGWMAKGFLKWLAILGGTGLFLFGSCNMFLTGCPIPLVHLESLDHPVAISGWNAAGLVSKDGRSIPVPGHSKLPLESKALSEATIRGVEIGKDGTVVGLARIWHWCGNDPVRFDLRRVDIGHLISYFERPTMDDPRSVNKEGSRDPGPYTKGGLFGDSGWNSSEASMFRHYEHWIAKGATGPWWK